MKEIAFETLKNRAISKFREGFNSDPQYWAKLGMVMIQKMLITGKPAPRPEPVLDEIFKECVTAIRSTDIRNLKALYDLVPKAFPTWYKPNRSVIAEMDDVTGEWMIRLPEA